VALEMSSNVICRHLLYLLFAVPALANAQSATTAEPVLQWDSNMHVEGPLLLGETQTGKILLWSGLGQDISPWIDVVDLQRRQIEKFSYIDASTARRVTPEIANVDDAGTRLIVLENKYLGSYDVLKNAGESIKSDLSPSFMSSPQWLSNKQLAFLDRRNWRSIWIHDLAKGVSTPIHFSPQKFISSFSVGSNGVLVIGMGPANEAMKVSKLGPDTFGIDQTKAERINLYRMFLETGQTKQLTDGPWFDFAPKVSPDGRYVAFLRGSPTALKADGEERTLSGSRPALYVYRVDDGGSTKIVQNRLVTTAFDFLWKDNSAILFRNPCGGRSTCVSQYDLATPATRVIYRGKELIRSFYWSRLSSRLFVVEDHLRGKTSLIVSRP
jgi:hypothetical protein